MTTTAELYYQLKALAEEPGDAFFVAKQTVEGYNYEVFLYRLASYTEFQKPGAFEARGITFIVENGKEPQIVSRPFAKFFNLGENPFTMNLDATTLQAAYTKLDGSLIATYQKKIKTSSGREFFTLGFKSKGSLVSEHAQLATEWFNQPTQQAFKREVEDLTLSDYTVMLELLSADPRLQIVLQYPETKLTVIGVRVNENGKLLSKASLDSASFPEITKNWVEGVKLPRYSERAAWLENVVSLKDIEGYVLHYPDQLVKVKTDWYRALHHTKDGLLSTEDVFLKGDEALL